MTRMTLGSPSFPTETPSISTQALLDAVSYRVTRDDAVAHVPTRDGGLEPDASILLLGIRGTGKTSLAILAASCTGFRLVDADQHFYQTTGLPRAAYVSKHGFEDYRARELSLMRTLLEQNPWRCIIVCGPGSAEGTGQELLKEFKIRHPVIYVMRDPGEVHQYLRTQDSAMISELIDKISPSYRSLSNFEFFNLSEPWASQESSPEIVGTHLQSHPSLVLKHVEDDFVRLINAIRSQTSRPRLFQAQHSLSHLPPESRPYTYALTISLEQVSDIALQLRSTDLVADAVQLLVNMESLLPGNGQFDQSAATYLTKQYYRLRRNVKLPIIIHVQLDTPGGPLADMTPNTWSAYFDILFHGLRLAPEYLTLNLKCSQQAAQELAASKAPTKIIGHFFDHAPCSEAWDSPSRLSIIQKAGHLGCDLVWICQRCTSPADNVAAQHFRHRAKREESFHIPLIAYNVGRSGRASCFTNSVLTPVTHVLGTSHSHAEDCAMLTVQDAQRALYASFILDKLVFGIFGSAVSSALSPVMHNAAFEFCGMPHVYQTFQSSSLHDLKHLVHDENFGGASISAPFKEEIMSVLDYVSPEAQAVGAVNTLIPLRSRRLESLVDRNHAGPVVALFGDNTDWIGIHTCIRRNLSPINAVKNRTTALILGAGGMARAAVYAALRLGVQTIFIYNRTTENADKLVNQFNGISFAVQSIDLTRSSPSISPRRYGISTPNSQTAGPAKVHSISSMDDPWPSGFDQPTIIVSCISRAGDNGQKPPDILLPDAWLSSPTGGVVIELAYNPVNTPLVQQVGSLSPKGWILVNGLQVLPEQGMAQFELFTGRKAPQHLMRAQVEQHA